MGLRPKTSITVHHLLKLPGIYWPQQDLPPPFHKVTQDWWPGRVDWSALRNQISIGPSNLNQLSYPLCFPQSQRSWFYYNLKRGWWCPRFLSMKQTNRRDSHTSNVPLQLWIVPTSSDCMVSSRDSRKNSVLAMIPCNGLRNSSNSQWLILLGR